MILWFACWLLFIILNFIRLVITQHLILIRHIGRLIQHRHNQPVIESCVVHAILFNILIDPRYHQMKIIGDEVAIRCLMLVSKNLSKSQMFFLFKSVRCLNWSINPPFRLDSIWGLTIFEWDLFLSRVVFNCESLILKKIPCFSRGFEVSPRCF